MQIFANKLEIVMFPRLFNDEQCNLPTTHPFRRMNLSVHLDGAVT